MSLPNLALVLVFLGALFLGIRRFWWWYLGIDRAIAALEDIAESLRTLPSVRSYDAQIRRKPPKAA